MSFRRRVEQQKSANQRVEEEREARQQSKQERQKLIIAQQQAELEKQVRSTFAWSQIEQASQNPELINALKSYFEIEKQHPVPATQETLNAGLAQIPSLDFEQCLTISNHFETKKYGEPNPYLTPYISIFLCLTTINQVDRDGDWILPKQVGLEFEIYYYDEEESELSEKQALAQKTLYRESESFIAPKIGIKYVLRSSATYPSSNRGRFRNDWSKRYGEPSYHIFESLDEFLNYLANEVTSRTE